jgi:hypothetical protein
MVLAWLTLACGVGLAVWLGFLLGDALRAPGTVVNATPG